MTLIHLESIIKIMNSAKLIQLPKIGDTRGNLSIIEQFKQIPFEIKRAHWIYDVPGGVDRGGHAYKRTEEFIVALSGSFDVVISNGEKETTYHLNRSYFGLYVPAGTWRRMTNFSTNSVALVLSSTEYNQDDYIFDYSQYKLWKQNPTLELRLSKNIIETREIQSYRKNVFECSLYELTRESDPEGNLTYIYENIHVPFPINRVFYSYDIPGGEERGAHAHKECHQFLVAASGSFEVVLDDGTNKRTVQLNRPFCGLHIPPGIWASEQGFSSGSVCLVLASHGYSEEDYIRSYEDYLKYIKED